MVLFSLDYFSILLDSFFNCLNSYDFVFAVYLLPGVLNGRNNVYQTVLSSYEIYNRLSGLNRANGLLTFGFGIQDLNFAGVNFFDRFDLWFDLIDKLFVIQFLAFTVFYTA